MCVLLGLFLSSKYESNLKWLSHLTFAKEYCLLRKILSFRENPTTLSSSVIFTWTVPLSSCLVNAYPSLSLSSNRFSSPDSHSYGGLCLPFQNTYTHVVTYLIFTRDVCALFYLYLPGLNTSAWYIEDPQSQYLLNWIAISMSSTYFYCYNYHTIL